MMDIPATFVCTVIRKLLGIGIVVSPKVTVVVVVIIMPSKADSISWI
jgi:hypothetical protein